MSGHDSVISLPEHSLLDTSLSIIFTHVGVANSLLPFNQSIESFFLISKCISTPVRYELVFLAISHNLIFKLFPTTSLLLRGLEDVNVMV